MLVAVFSRHDQALQWARDRVHERWGSVVLSSPKFSFQETNYYEHEMGVGLIKQFHIVDGWFDPQLLAQRKLDSNAWETEFANMGLSGDQRPLNIDPGYITPTKLILASTKDRSHRIYLANGIYAEETLYYHDRRWQSRPWTYTDYKRTDFQEFFSVAREWMKTEVSALTKDHSQ